MASPLPTWKELFPGCPVQAPGSAINNHTGSWRSERPVWNEPAGRRERNTTSSSWRPCSESVGIHMGVSDHPVQMALVLRLVRSQRKKGRHEPLPVCCRLASCSCRVCSLWPYKR